MTAIRNFIIVILFSITSILGADAKPFLWIMAKTPGKISTNFDIQKFIENIYLDDQKRIELFKEANSNFNQYEVLKSKWAEKYMESAVKQDTYFKIVEAEATRGNQKNWLAFKVTLSQYMDKVREVEDRAIKDLLATGKGIAYASVEFGKKLRAKGWPVKNGVSDRDLYYEWLELQKERIKEQFRISEVQKYESIMARKFNPELRVRPLDIFDTYTDAKNAVENKIDNKRMDSNDIAKILTEDKVAKLAITDIKYLSLNDMNSLELHKLDQNVFAEELEFLSKNLKSAWNQDKVNKILSYEKAAKSLANKYKDAELLKKKAREATIKYLENNGDLNQYLLSQLYVMAAIYIETNVQVDISEFLRNSVQLKISQATEAINDTNWVLSTENSSFLIEDRIQQLVLKTNTKPYSELTSYEKAAVDMASWSLKYEVKRINALRRPIAKVEYLQINTFEGQKVIRHHLQMQEYTKGLERFRNVDLRRNYEGFISINLDGRTSLFGEDAMNFILDKN